MNRVARNLLYPFSAVLISVGLVMAFHDALFRWLALRLVQQVPGVEAQLDGALDLTHVAPLTLEATDVDLRFTGGKLTGGRASLGTVHLEMRLWPLLRGAVHIQRMRVTDADGEIPLAASGETPEPSPSSVRLPFVEEADLERVRVRIERAANRPPHELTIANLRLGEGEDGAMTATGSMSLDGHALTLNAHFGSLQELVHPTVPFPVEATLRAPSWDLEAEVSGTLGEPLEGGRAQLDMRARTSDLSALRDVFFPDAPLAGSVDASAHLSGNLDAPALSDVNLNIADEDRLDVTLSGNIADLLRMEGMDVQIDALSQDPAVTQYVTQETLPSLQSIRLQTTVRGEANDYRLQALDVRVSGRNSLSASARGSLRLTDLASPWPIENAGLDLQVSAAVADLATWLPPEVGTSGTLRFRAHLEGSAKSLAFDDLKLDLQDTSPLRGTLSGKLAYTLAQLEAIRTRSESSAALWNPSDVDLLLELSTADLQSLAPLLGQTLPDLGALSATAQLRRAGDALRITRLDAQTTGERPLDLSATGELDLVDMAADPGMTGVDLKVMAQGPDGKSVASLVGSLPFDPGPWHLKADVVGKTGALRAEGIEFESGTNESVQTRLEGRIADLEGLIRRAGKAPTGVVFKGYATAPSTQQLGTWIGRPLPNLGSFDALFDIQGEKALWSIPVASLTVAHTAGFDLRATGEANDLLHDARFHAQLELRVPDPQRTAAAMAGSLPRLPGISADGQIQGNQKGIQFDGRIDVGTMPFTADLDADFTDPRPHLSGTFSTPVLRLSDFANPQLSTNVSSDKSGTLDSVTARERAELDRLFSDQPLGFKHLHHADIDFKLIADRVEGERIRTERLEMAIEVGNGRLKAHHEKLQHADGAISVALEVDNATDTPRATIRGRGDNLALGALYAQVSSQSRLHEGLYSFDLELTGSGHSLQALAATANGHYGHVLENARLEGEDLDTLNFGLLRLVMASAVEKDHTDVDCDISKFRVNDGLAVSETLYLRTPKMVAAGTGHLNFSEETLNIVVHTETKRRLRKRKAVLHLHGPIREPEIDADLTSAAITAGLETAVIGAVIVELPPLGFALVALDTLEEFITDGEQQPCVSGGLSKK